MMKPKKYANVVGAGMTPRDFMWNTYMYAYNSACDDWLRWCEELRVALGAKPGDDLIEYAKKLRMESEQRVALENDATASLIESLQKIIDAYADTSKKQRELINTMLWGE